MKEQHARVWPLHAKYTYNYGFFNNSEVPAPHPPPQVPNNQNPEKKSSTNVCVRRSEEEQSGPGCEGGVVAAECWLCESEQEARAATDEIEAEYERLLYLDPTNQVRRKAAVTSLCGAVAV